MTSSPNRRQVLEATGVAAASALTSTLLAEEGKSGNLERHRKHSVAQWCFADYWKLEEMCQISKRLGATSIELVPPKDWDILKKHGLICAMTTSHGFDKGMNNPKYHEMCLEKLHSGIDASAEAGFPNVITFTGFREDVPDDVGIKNCVEGFKKIVGYAEKKKVNLCLEMLNSRVNENMKGHPGYQGDHTDYCVEILKKVASPRLKLLFDVYHVQIMDGDIISRIRQHAEWIGHVHTAGNPGRCELDAKQEINYGPVMKALTEIGFQGYTGHEFIPTRDPLAGLKEAMDTCDC